MQVKIQIYCDICAKKKSHANFARLFPYDSYCLIYTLLSFMRSLSSFPSESEYPR